MSDYLIKQAISTIWQNPKQDSQMVLKPARLTPYGGVWRSWKFMWTSVVLPTNNHRYHIYSIGQINPLLVNLFPISDEWKRVADSCMATDTLVEIYTQKGIRIPITQVYYIFTEESSLLFCVRKDSNLFWDFNNEEIYIRLYDNAYFESNRNPDTHLYIEGKTVTSTNDILAIQTNYLIKKALPGKVYSFVNGYRVKDISLITVVVNDTVEFYHDPSVLISYEFSLTDLQTFDSILDTKRKYLLHPEGGIGNNIYYQDDVDTYIYNKTSKKGVYYHKNNVDNLRMVTHRDYSISVPVISSFLNQHEDLFDYTTATVELNIRQSGYLRPLVDEHMRIKELYKLTDAQVQAAMIGVDSTLDNWRCDQLENSNYTKVMRSSFSSVDLPLARDTYGYNAVVKMAAFPVLKTELFNSQVIARMPYSYLSNSTGYEFDNNGLLINRYFHVVGENYICTNSNAKYVMMVRGAMDNSLDEYYNVQSVELDPNYEYRFYVADKDSVHPGTVWTDVTGSAMYALINNVATWLVMDTKDVLIRSNKKHLHKQFYLDPLAGSMVFNLTHLQDVDGVLVDAIMQIPMGELKVYLNGHSLVRDLDYFVNFPVVTITNKDYLVNQNTTLQQIDYIFTGLCDEDLNFSTYAESGFIRNGYLSVNNRFDIRDDKANFITANGRIYVKEDLSFVEDSHEFIFNSILNGKPYCVEDAVVPVKDLTGVDTYEFRKASVAVDKAVSDYLTLKIPQPEIPALNPILRYYELYSPFINEVIFAVITSAIDPNALKVQYNDDKVRELVAPYLYLLSMDPIYVDNQPDRNYCIIHPHILGNVIEVDVYQHKFITRVVNLYGNGLVNLSGHLILV